MAAAVHFYRDVIGLDLLADHAGWPHFDLDGSYLVIVEGTPAHTETTEEWRFPHIALAVDDLDAAIGRLRDHDVALPWDVEVTAHSRWIMFQDPAENPADGPTHLRQQGSPARAGLVTGVNARRPGSGIAGVSDAVRIRVQLAAVGHARTVVASVTHGVGVRV